MGGWIKLHNEELHNLYSSPNIIGMTMSRIMAGQGRAYTAEKRYADRNMVGKPEGKRAPGKPRPRWEENN
jgi:hypothetical protein